MILDWWHEWRLLVGLVVLALAVVLRQLVAQDAASGASAAQSSTVAAAAEKRGIVAASTSAPAPRETKSDYPPAKAAQPTIGPRRIRGQPTSRKVSSQEDQTPHAIQPLVFFSSLGGSTEKRAKDLLAALQHDLSHHTNAVQPIRSPQLLDLSEIELDDYFTAAPTSKEAVKFLYLILLPTYNIDTNLDLFLNHLQETHHDFRVDTAPLASLLGYSVFGFGDRQGWPTEADGFCSQAKEVDKWLAKLTLRKRAYPLGMGDTQSDVLARLDEWRQGVVGAIKDLSLRGSLGEGVPGSGDPVESDDEVDIDEQDDQDGGMKKSKKRGNGIVDLETLGGGLAEEDGDLVPIDFTTYKKTKAQPPTAVPKEMVPKSSPTYASLTKQGYTIVGSHSGVKICRWTKSALRGRGSCYKFSFYGIKSHLCMETTPSLSCSNKCVFCWRHGTNPVGTTWRWQVDDPDTIFNGVKEGHYKKIKMMRGVPGVRAERFEEAMRIRHCALSLVGEPIFYPYINEFTALLHNEHISSFLVCNAQHPDQLATLKPVTQLYVSIDASNKESLRKIDRPLHRDFWERFCRCLDILKEKRFRQRTVYRLTLVKGFNIEDEAEGYADLVERGLPCLVEVKGVTYCGTSTSAGAGLSMQNVPFYEEVCAFVEALNAALERRGLGYGIAAEHAHSCCILLASNRFLVNGKWHTQIDYTKFFSLLESGREFSPEEYMAPTVEWALWGNGGFDPADERVDRKGRKKEVVT